MIYTVEELDRHVEEVKAHALEEFPKESCGVLTPDGYRSMTNISSTPEETFEFKREEQIEVSDSHIAVIHSHTKSGERSGAPFPSMQDMQSQILTAKPWGILGCDGESCTSLVWFGDQVERRPLLDRPFIYGVYDCYSLGRDYYREKLGIIVEDVPRDWAWWEKDKDGDMYKDLFESQGFVQFQPSQEPQVGDVCFMSIRSAKENHCAIYLGHNLIMHHLCGHSPIDITRIPVETPLARYSRLITRWIRHERLQ